MRSPPDAFEAALRLLGRRAHSEQELNRKLTRRGCPADEVEAAIDRLRRLGYLDDAAFAHALVSRRAHSRGPALIAAELATKGVDRELAREAVSQLDRTALVDAARRRASGAAGTDRRRAAARLRRLGYPSDVVREALAIGLDEGDEGE